MKPFWYLLTLCLSLVSSVALGAEPAFVIRDVRVVPVAGEATEKTTVTIIDGKIAEVGRQAKIPPGAQTIDGRGMTLYPGLFDCMTNLGLTEIGQVSATNDYSEMGSFMPHLMSWSALHVESEHIPVTRAAGITHALTYPRGERISGQAAIVNLDGWTPEQMEIRRSGAMILNFPGQPGLRPPGYYESPYRRARPYAELQQEYRKDLGELELFFDKARHYMRARQTAGQKVSSASDARLQAMIPVLKGERPVVVIAQWAPDIRAAVKFATDQRLNYMLYSTGEVWKVLDFLKENKVRVILGPMQRLPETNDAAVDVVYRTPALLHQRGIPFAIATGDSADSRNLPYEAGNAVGYGLPYDVALRAITLTPAEFFRIDDELGSIQPGRRANLVLVRGDILDYSGEVKQLWINGKSISLETKHTQLYEKYKNRR